MRRPSESDFSVQVENIGRFVFARRKMRDEIQIQVEYANLIQGVEPTGWLQNVCGWIAAFNVLLVSAPDGWDVEEMDPLDNETYKGLMAVYNALRDKELSFRTKPEQGSEEPGEEDL